MAIGKSGVCSGCNKERWLSKPSLMLCAYCNKKRLNSKKEPKKATGEAAMFREIWEERDHSSFLSGESLEGYYGKDKWYSLFAHILPKGTYPGMRLKKHNIVLLTPFEHFLLDQGTETNRTKYGEKFKCDWNKIYELKYELLNEDRTTNG
tara:strand:+ start:30540 stop:30989 length:450 start_codon:yes stop_codon:yes gene_type:complete